MAKVSAPGPPVAPIAQSVATTCWYTCYRMLWIWKKGQAADPGDPADRAAPARAAWTPWVSAPAIAPAATAGPSSKVTGSPRWLVRDQAFWPPGGRRFSTE